MIKLRVRRPALPPSLKTWLLDMGFAVTHDRGSIVYGIIMLGLPIGVFIVGAQIPGELVNLIVLFYIMAAWAVIGVYAAIVLSVWRRSRVSMIEIRPVKGISEHSISLRESWNWGDEFLWTYERGGAVIVADYRTGDEGDGDEAQEPAPFNPYGWATANSINSGEVYEKLNFWEPAALFKTRSGRMIPVTLSAMVIAMGVMGLVFFVQVQTLVNPADTPGPPAAAPVAAVTP